MTKRLILMRHAKSSWDNALLDDFARALNGRGRTSAKALGDWIRQKSYLPDQVLCSSAARTRETFAGLKVMADTAFVDTLYHASADQMMRTLQRATGSAVLMIGHNPGISWFAAQLVLTPPSHTRFSDYPTGAATVIDFDIAEWAELRPATGQVVDFVIPRELTG
ncbi:Histidine phosphatase superfamily (branch 1) [Roseovarius albus]|uniref:Histidine phosphatase superfamily (Branch 1) n=1 Tax=Roseovarius albus TaxID=1247867 RepID=A0A1X6ZUD9_9RHOB|nr:histidine phosphatase family protein [Roseovarius albus]SLN61780.1 Histidine phosphatase superfamily (branch 1) [Roseovarius albus]